MTDAPLPPGRAPADPPPSTTLDPREIYLAYVSLAVIVAAFVAVTFIPADPPAQPAQAAAAAHHP